MSSLEFQAFIRFQLDSQHTALRVMFMVPLKTIESRMLMSIVSETLCSCPDLVWGSDFTSSISRQVAEEICVLRP